MGGVRCFTGQFGFLWHYSDDCALSWIKFHQQSSHSSRDDRSDWRACWSVSVVMLLKRRQSFANSLVREERTTFGRSLMYERKRKVLVRYPGELPTRHPPGWNESPPAGPPAFCLSAKNNLIQWNVFLECHISRVCEGADREAPC